VEVEKLEIEEVIVALIGIFAVLLMILTFGELYGGEWETVAQYIAPIILAIIVFGACIGGVAYWRK
jgi:hypothetical protein